MYWAFSPPWSFSKCDQIHWKLMSMILDKYPILFREKLNNNQFQYPYWKMQRKELWVAHVSITNNFHRIFCLGNKSSCITSEIVLENSCIIAVTANSLSHSATLSCFIHKIIPNTRFSLRNIYLNSDNFEQRIMNITFKSFRNLSLPCNNPAGFYLLKVNNRNTITRCEICSKLTKNAPERRQASFWCVYC